MIYDVLTVGHSTLSYERFLTLLRGQSVDAIADVRSAPFSRHFPHFNRNALQARLREDEVAYVFLGDSLGGRPASRSLFDSGIASYERMARTEDFARGLDRVIDGSRKYRIAMMCSEHDPLDCHRCLLVGRALREREFSVGHILGNGMVISQAGIEDKLIALAGKQNTDFFEPYSAQLAAAYRDRATKVAYAEPKVEADHSLSGE